MSDRFRLGEEWPDWWADLVTANVVTTHNIDGRWRGGPDYALIRHGDATTRIASGEWVCRKAVEAAAGS